MFCRRPPTKVLGTNSFQIMEQIVTPDCVTFALCTDYGEGHLTSACSKALANQDPLLQKSQFEPSGNQWKVWYKVLVINNLLKGLLFWLNIDKSDQRDFASKHYPLDSTSRGTVEFDLGPWNTTEDNYSREACLAPTVKRQKPILAQATQMQTRTKEKRNYVMNANPLRRKEFAFRTPVHSPATAGRAELFKRCNPLKFKDSGAACWFSLVGSVCLHSCFSGMVLVNTVDLFTVASHLQWFLTSSSPCSGVWTPEVGELSDFLLSKVDFFLTFCSQKLTFFWLFSDFFAQNGPQNWLLIDFFYLQKVDFFSKP